MKEQCYKYIFTHMKTKAKLKFETTSFEMAISMLGLMVNSVNDWTMKRFKCK